MMTLKTLGDFPLAGELEKRETEEREEKAERPMATDLVTIETKRNTSLLPVRFMPPVDAEGLVDALVAGQLSPRTRRAYASDLAELVSVLRAWGLKLDGVTKDHLNAYRSWLAGEDVPGLVRKEKPLATASVSRKVSVCRQFFAEALDRGLTETNPAPRLRGFSVSQDSKTLSEQGVASTRPGFPSGPCGRKRQSLGGA